MFTGLVEEKGEVVAIDDLGDSARLTVRAPLVTGDAGHGDSIAVNGCCLTVAGQGDGTFTADVMAESLARTSLGDLSVGDEVNLERAMPVAGRLGGHVVQGHVDGTGTLLERSPAEHWTVLRFSLPADLARYVVEKGSITVDGTSLTVVDVTDDDAGPGGGAGPWAANGTGSTFSISLIPTTLAETTLGSLSVGDRVNLEVDILAKYVERLLGTGGPR